jgi:hypothetical protein
LLTLGGRIYEVNRTDDRSVARLNATDCGRR